MKNRIYIFRLYSVSVAVYILSALAISPALQAQDYARLGERTIMGTARYVGMSGAMTAIGGDPSAVMDNVAGLGLYQRPEAMLTFDYTVKSIFMAPQASAVFCLPTDNLSDRGILCHNFMISYHREHCFNMSICPTGTQGRSLGALFAKADGDLMIDYTTDRYNETNELKLDERGYVNEYAFDWSMNISHRWYWGLGLRVNSFLLTSEGDYTETFKEINPDKVHYYNRNRTSLILSGVGCSFATGLIYRPLQWLRLGVGFETPSFGALSINSAGSFDALRDSLQWSDAPDLTSHPSDFHMPLHLSTSVAFQICQYAMIALQYDYRHTKGQPDSHSLRAGVEVVPIHGLYINAGYAYDSSFQRSFSAFAIDPSLNRQDAYFQYPLWNQYISGGVGYRGTRFIVQAAYQFHMRRVNLYAHENADPYRISGNQHRIVLTLAWHGHY